MKPIIRTLTILLAITATLIVSAASDSQGTPGGGAGAVKVRVASNLKEKDAAQLQRYLQADGYGSGASIEVAQDASGTFSVLIGPLESEAQANALIKDLQESGYQPEGLVQADASAGKVVSRAEAGRVFRVMVGEFPDRRQAEGLMQTLIADDYAGVDILEESGTYKVVIGAFATERDSEKLVEQLRNDGYSLAKAIETRETAPAARPAAIEEKEIALPAEAQRLTPEEQEKAKELIRMRERASAGLASADEIMQLREDLKKLRSEVAQVVKLVTTNEQANREKQRKLRPIQEKFNNALLAKNVQAAEAALEEMRAVDPNDPSLAFYVAQLNAVRAGPTAEGQKTEEQRRIQQLLNEARAHLAANRLEDARIALLSMKAIDPAHPEVQRLQKEISEKQQKPAPTATASGPQNQMLMLYVGGGVLVLLVVGLAAYVFVTSRRERKILAEVQELAAGAGTVAAAKIATEKTPETKEAEPSERKEKVKPTAAPKVEPAPVLGGIPNALAGAGALGSSILSKVATAEPEPEEEPVQKSAPEIFRAEISEAQAIQETRPAGEADVLVLNDLVSAPTAASESVSSGDLQLPELDIPLPGLEETQTALPPETTQEPSPLNLEAISSVNLDDLIGVAREEAPPEAPAQTAPSSPKVSIHEETTVVPTETPTEVAAQKPPVETSRPLPESTAAFEPTTKLEAVAASVAPAQTGKRVIFEQTFDDEEPGTQPRGWQGEYDYATLVVDTTSPAPGSKACLKFEKRTGAGSAHYVCHFAKATGLVVVEFDIRCDEKNKYLLGFYVEKDEDFKQSVHTIIHRLDSRSQPTLRVQGEPVPYELGTWRHVKYELNLLAGTATAYVDGQEVVRDAKLASNYGYVNTLSIRDNLATTGVLYLDNIKIYEA
ncbi:MAG: SPOR domain-containing protein [Candidatus Sumerlaeaceae bacterium]|nr:SPOR domain-containing protein [Candidatus Sumerlaeaceae bacterium]